MAQPKLLSPAEVADEFGVSPVTVSRWADDKLLPSVKTLGGHRRFRRADVEALLASRDSEEAS